MTKFILSKKIKPNIQDLKNTIPVPNIKPTKKEKIKIKVCIASYDGPEPSCDAAIRSLDTFGSEYIITAVEVRHAGVCFARNELAEDFKNYDFILWVDTDIAFTHTNLKIALAANKDVYGCAYRHHNTGKIVCNEMYPWGFNRGPVKTKWPGWGFVLEKTSVYKDVKKPYFAMPPKEDGGLFSEDEYHCTSVLKTDDIWIDTSNRVQHIKAKGLTTVKLEDQQWGHVLKAVATLPMSYLDSHPLVTSLHSQLKVSKVEGNI